MLTFSVINLGCKVNRAESDSVELELASMGMVQDDKCCDIVVINTCTVTAVAEKKTRKTVRSALVANPSARIIVTGCAAAQDKSVYESMSSRVEVVLKWDLSSYMESLRTSIEQERDRSQSLLSEKVKNYCRANVKVQDGCINDCAYCIIHKLRGPEKSEDADSILARTMQLVDAGISEVILSGINLGRYKSGDIDLSRLCTILIEGERRCRFRLSSIEPNNLTDDVIDTVSESDGRICGHFHLPLQSGCNKTLMSMKRKYSTMEYLDVVNRIRSKIPNASISTDIICGFPGESETDFRDTVDFCKLVGFSKIHVFPYSPRRGTAAYEMDDQIDKDIKLERARILRETAKQLRKQDLMKRAGTYEMCVIEDEDWCMTESYHRIAAPKGHEAGSLVRVLL